MATRTRTVLSIDWLGCLLTAGALLLLFRGPWRHARVVLCLVLGEVGRALAALAVGGRLDQVVIGGAFSGLQASFPENLSLSVAGLWIALLLALPLGGRLRRDSLHYGLLGSGLVILLR